MSDPFPVFTSRPSSTELVILLHAFRHTRQNLSSLRSIVLMEMPAADVLVPDLPLGTFSTAKPSQIVSSLLTQIDELWQQKIEHGDPYRSITIIGHSMGALIGRKLYVCACGEHKKRAPFEEDIEASHPRPWADCVDRIILLAGMNRGWEINHHLSKFAAITWTLGVFFGDMFRILRLGDPIIFAIRRGSVFLTELRVQWLLMRRSADEKCVGKALTIQLLGSIDDMVSPNDNVDLVVGRDFVYLDVPHSGHENVIEFDDARYGEGRRKVLLNALKCSEEELEQKQILPADTGFGEPDASVTDVVFVIHGIRDEGYWTHKIARKIKEKGKLHNRVIATETSSYGYFPIAQFVFPSERNRKMQWFMDQCVEAMAMYPAADLSFVGHSHGTYLLARALELYTCCRFQRVVFAGSVVHTRYNWDKRKAKGQIEEVANYVATNDWVVAWFPGTFQKLRFQDLGGAGHLGFESPLVQQVTYVQGDHGAAIQEDNWQAIADFVLGQSASSPSPLLKQRHDWLSMIPGLLIWLVIVLVAFGGALGLTWVLTWQRWEEWQLTLALTAYIYAVWLFIKKF